MTDNQNEGEKLRELLGKTRFDQKMLGDASGVTKAAVGKWLKHKKFTERTWAKVSKGLTSLGLDPGEIRREESRKPIETLSILVEKWNIANLLTLRQILYADKDSIALLRSYLDGVSRQNS